MERIFYFVVFCMCVVVDSANRAPQCPSPCRCLLFDGLYSVYCNRTGITTVPSGIPTNTQLLDLSENSISRINQTDLETLVNLQQLYLYGNGLNENSIAPGALDLPKLDTIELAGNQFHTIPTFLPKWTKTLWLMYNQLTELKVDSFEKYKELQYLDVSNNQISKIEARTFDPLINLETLYISFNKLTGSSFPPNAFTKMVRLRLLSTRFNALSHLLKNLPPSVTYLDYVGNQIRTIPAYAFKSLPNLQSMEFWEGQITNIEDNAFYGLPQLTILDFSQDHISSTITNSTFIGLSGLQTLYMYLNNVSKIEPGALKPLESITSLWLQDNKLSTLDPEVLNVKYISHLSELFIDGNPWNCDCHLRWLREKVGNASYTIQDPHLITCARPPKVAGKAWDVLKPSDFVCD